MYTPRKSCFLPICILSLSPGSTRTLSTRSCLCMTPSGCPCATPPSVAFLLLSPYLPCKGHMDFSGIHTPQALSSVFGRRVGWPTSVHTAPSVVSLFPFLSAVSSYIFPIHLRCDLYHHLCQISLQHHYHLLINVGVNECTRHIVASYNLFFRSCNEGRNECRFS
jgi:hypothetical protein